MAAVRFSNTPSAKILTALARSRPTVPVRRRSTRPASWASPASTRQRMAATARPVSRPRSATAR